MTPRRLQGGFSLVELGLAIVVLSIGILGVLAAFSFGIESTRYKGRYTEAEIYARQLVELVRIRNHPFQDDKPQTGDVFELPGADSGVNDDYPPAGWDPEEDLQRIDMDRLRDLNASPFTADLPGGTGFKRSIRITRLSQHPGYGEDRGYDPYGAYDPDTTNYNYWVAHIEVAVYWWEKDAKKVVKLVALHRNL